MPYNNMNMAGDAGVSAIAAVAIANAKINGSVTRRTPHRSTNLPTKGVQIAPTNCDIVIAIATVARCQPNSATSGFKNTPKVKSVIGPFPTIRPKVDPNTTHQEFLKARTQLLRSY